MTDTTGMVQGISICKEGITGKYNKCRRVYRRNSTAIKQPLSWENDRGVFLCCIFCRTDFVMQGISAFVLLLSVCACVPDMLFCCYPYIFPGADK